MATGDDDTLDRLWRSADKPSIQIEPLDDHIVVEPSDDAHETRVGLIIPAQAESPVRSGVVVAVGDEVHGVAPGDKVIFPRQAGVELRLAGEPLLLVRRRDLIARYSE
jgi:co-chaperonin GroES (HSP10)